MTDSKFNLLSAPVIKLIYNDFFNYLVLQETGKYSLLEVDRI